MLENYEINSYTIAITYVDSTTSKVYEYDKEFLVHKSTIEIIDSSCKYFGSSYQGRFEGTKSLTGYNYKSPIIVEESNKMIFFPLSSPRFENCNWISLNHIKDHFKIGFKTIVLFRNMKEIEFDISINSFENQLLRSTRLKVLLEDNLKYLKIG